MQLTIQEILDSVKAKVSFVYDAIYPHYNESVEGVVLDVDWWLAQDLGVKLERKGLREAMAYRKKVSELPEGGGQLPGKDRDELAIKRALRNKPELVAEAIANLPSENRRALNEHVLDKTIKRGTGKPPIPKERIEAKNASTAGYAVLHELGKAEEAISRALAMWGVGEIDEDQFAEATELLDRISMAMEGFKAHDWDAF